jgi:hypothetical protein
MEILSVAGATSRAGKTALAVTLIRAFPRATVAAVKFTTTEDVFERGPLGQLMGKLLAARELHSGALGGIRAQAGSPEAIPPGGVPRPTEPGPPAARVSLTYPGFPAYVALQPGDLIVAVNGKSLPNLPPRTDATPLPKQ